MTFTLRALALASLMIGVQPLVAASPVPVMLLDGESGGPWHKWQLTTPVLKTLLEETGRFRVDVVTAPPAGGDLEAFAPDFARYRVVVWNYDAPDERWPARIRDAFERYVSGGGGVVIVHGADNAVPGGAAFNEVIGIGGWRGRTEKSGPYHYYKDNRLVADPSPGPGGSHGRRVPFLVTSRAESHPIMRGLPREWMHHGDELYARLRGPGRNMTVLATAFSPADNQGTDRDEPILMALTWGKGRIFHTTLGHDVNGMSSVGFVVTFQRGTEWAATGEVTLPVPDTFPNSTTVAYRADIAAMDPNFSRGLNPLDQAK